MKIEYIKSLDVTAGRSFGRLLKRCYFCSKVTPRHCSIDGVEESNLGRPLRVCLKCQKRIQEEDDNE